ncbi:hypothetical protein GCM10009623_30620 [Nocardioides aestuarii]|uniref:Sulfotransferase family protein n=1 Tax=Nocardioides aestuarii TaxID=252231 RepID=A0ABW4TP62_9ACTN
MPDTGTPRRVFLHLGLQKTGTSYLQGVLQQNAGVLADQGLDLLPAGRREAFELMLVVRDRFNPERDPASAAGALERFSAALDAAPGDRALVSQESLAASRPPQVRRLLDACGDREVHVVLTVRDLARQLPSSWQQELKSGKTESWGDYLARLRDYQERGLTRHPWIQLDPPTVLARWAEHLAPERIHVVTVPPRGSRTDLLLARFCEVLGVDPATLEPSARASNTSLGMAQAELLRRVNGELSAEHRRRQVYGDVGKRFFASQVLGQQQGDRILVPDDVRGWCVAVAEQQAEAIREAGYDVVGTLEDLRCFESAFDPGDPTPAEPDVAAAAVAALGTVLTQRSEAAVRRRTAGEREGGLRGRLRRLAGGGREGDAAPDDLDDDES